MLSNDHRDRLLQLARQVVVEGTTQRGKPRIELASYPPELQEKRASFVTLEIDGELRGCIGTLQAVEPLAADIAKNAYLAAFEDPRFPSVMKEELDELAFHISILSLPELLPVQSEEELLTVLRPQIDGLILEDGAKRGTFLPAVWESLPDPRQFLLHLKRKAGMPDHHWSPSLVVKRYTTESFPK